MDRASSMESLELEVGVLLRRIRRVLAERARLVDPALNSISYLLFARVADVGPVRASELADTFHLDKGAVSRQVQHLVDLGLLDRQPDPYDGRASLLVATKAGHRSLARVTKERRDEVQQKLADFTDGDLDDLVRLLGRYNEALDRSPVD